MREEEEEREERDDEGGEGLGKKKRGTGENELKYELMNPGFIIDLKVEKEEKRNKK